MSMMRYISRYIAVVLLLLIIYCSATERINIVNEPDSNTNNHNLNLYSNKNQKNNRIDFFKNGYNVKNSSSSSSSSTSSSDSGSPVPTPTPTAPPGYLDASTFMYFKGGKSHCNEQTCQALNYSYSKDYACSEGGRGDWNNGANSFLDPLPIGSYPPDQLEVDYADFIFSGSFNCDNSLEPTTVGFVIDSAHYFSGNISDASDCSCGSCYVNYTLSFNLTGGLSKLITNYNYSGLNNFQIVSPGAGSTDSICLTMIEIKFYYKVVPPPPTTAPPTLTPTPPPETSPGAEMSPTVKKWLIIAGSITGGLIILVLLGVFVKSQRNRSQYKQLKDGKQVDIKQIKLGERIGKGNFGEVYIGFWMGSKIAVKKLPAHNMNVTLQKEIQREIELMKSLRHPNIIQYLGSSTSDIEICIFTEYMARGSLYSILHNKKIDLQWSLIVSMCMDAAKGIIYLHNSTPVILHRDLKSHNLLVDSDYRVKVADFGLSTIEQSATMTACGTPCWSAPEVLRSQRYTEKADVYSFGIVLWECATRMDPYAGLPPFQVIFAVGKEGLRPPVPKSGPPEFIKLIQDCWTENHTERPNMETVLKRLEAIDTNGYSEIIYVDSYQNGQQNHQIQNININNQKPSRK